MQIIATPRTFFCGLGRHAIALLFLFQIPLLPAQIIGDPQLEIFLKAGDYYDKGNFPLAVREYKKFLKAAPKHPRVPDSKWQLGLAYIQLKQWASAEVLMRGLAASKDAPDVPGAFYYWGHSLLMLKRPANAEAAFLDGLKKNPEARLAGFRLGLLEARFQQKKWKAVKESVDALPAEQQGNGRVMFQDGFASFMLRDFQTAAKEFDVLKRRAGAAPFAHQARFFLAESLRELGQSKQAIVEYAAARKVPGEYVADALYREGFLNFQIREYQQAAKLFAQFRAEHKQHRLRDVAGLSLGQAHLQARNFKEADFVFRTLAKEQDANADIALWHSRVFNRQKKYAEAAAILAPAVKQFPAAAKMEKLLFDLGENYFGARQFTESAAVFERLLRAFPKHSQRELVLRLTAQARFQTERYDVSLALCEKFLNEFKDHPETASIVFLKGENQFFQGQYAEAIATYDQFIGKHPQHPQAAIAQMHTGESYFLSKQWEKGLVAFDKLADHKRKGAAFQQYDLLMGNCFFKLEEWEKAVNSFQLFTARFPKAPNADAALMNTGLALEAMEQVDNAMAVYEQLAKEHPKSVHLSHAALKVGKHLFEAKQFTKMRSALKVTAQKKGDPNQALAIFYLGFADAAEGKTNEALLRLEKLANDFPEDANAPLARMKVGDLQFGSDQFEAAQKSYQSFLNKYPKHERADEARYHLGSALAGQEEWDAAVKSFQAVGEDSEWISEALYQSAWCDRKAGRAGEAQKKYELFISKHPESDKVSDANLEMADLEYEAGKYKEAISRLETLMEAETSRRRLALARFRLGHSFSRLKEWEKAADSFKTFLRSNPRHELTRRVQLGLGRVQIQQDEDDDALRSLSGAVRGSDGDEVGAEAQFLRGEIYLAQEKFDEAIAEFAKVDAFEQFDEWRADALYGQVLALEGKDDSGMAVEKLNAIVTQFPDSAAAQKAKEKLNP